MRPSFDTAGVYQRRKNVCHLWHGERYLCHCLLYGGECIYLFLLPSSQGFNLQFFQKLITVFTGAGLIATLIYLIFCNKYDRNAVMNSATNGYTMIPSIRMILLGWGGDRTKIRRKKSDGHFKPGRRSDLSSQYSALGIWQL